MIPNVTRCLPEDERLQLNSNDLLQVPQMAEILPVVNYLISLPHELLILIFRSQNSILDALNLSSTCHYLHLIFHRNICTITPSLFLRDTGLNSDRLRLAQAQQMLKARGFIPACNEREETTPESSKSPASSPLEYKCLLPRLCENSRDAERICDLTLAWFAVLPGSYDYGETNSCPNPAHIKRQHFLHCWYLLKLCTLSPFSADIQKGCDDLLASSSIGELNELWMIIEFLDYKLKSETMKELGMWDGHSYRDDGVIRRMPGWDEATEKILKVCSLALRPSEWPFV